MNPSLILPMAAHVALTAFLYFLLTAVRAPAVWGVGRRGRDLPSWTAFEPRISANLSNQFEWPLFFHLACLLLMSLHAVDTWALWLAWIFVAGRLLHSGVQILIPNIRLRGLVFTVNFLAAVGLWIRVLMLWPH
ncbi:MAPEG family protein [Oleiagrimonas sp. MCCC 1A03011]|uniref:MAPEG family protein n=1 Tax=Oleiagrimonas sp. MCCC 1A03011 TaxID=1926883 RepID=UPI000DC30FDD|nr:MAPEG family protein [Oleiagrimonas sp. MCCC 1A03011]RAP58271.1 hypothetical protein BTJ49_04705 [Oleiagrimonas sp. MCCC 1A03011]